MPEAAPAVDRWREQTCNSKPSQGVPPHITVVFPFAPLDETVIASLTEIFAALPAFEFELRTAVRFPDILYLAPEPPELFLELIEAVVRRFPAYPPYEGAYETVIPHLTVAQGDESALRDAENDVRRSLPIRAVAREAVLLEEVEPDGARWQVRCALPLRS